MTVTPPAALAVPFVTADELAHAVGGSRPAVVKFGARWCPPCRQLAPAIEQLAAERPDLLVVQVNTDTERFLTQHYEVLTIPTTLLIRDGVVLTTLTGVASPELLARLIDQSLA